jgi:hypothetical protein
VSGLIEHDLDSAGRDWVRYCLSFGKPLSRLVSAKKDLSGGRTSTFLPEGVPSDQIRHLDRGILPASSDRAPGERERLDPVDPDRALVDVILEYLALSPLNLCVFEDPIASSSDPVVQVDRERTHTCEGSVYVIVTSKASSRDIRKALSLVRPAYPPFIAVLTGSPEGTQFSHELEAENLRRFAARTKAILTGAYDGEGFVVWRSDEHPV